MTPPKSRWPARALLCAALGVVMPAASAAPPAPRNVLFIALDDLNDWVGAFGGSAQARTPHLDAFARGGAVVFQRAQCPGPVCGPSRSALLSGFMPHRSGVYGNSQNMLRSALVQTHATLPEYFSQHGYHAASMGKIFHKHPADQGHWAFDRWENTSGGFPFDGEHQSSRVLNLVDGKPGPKLPPADAEADGGDEAASLFAWGPTREAKEKTSDYRTAQWAAQQLAQPPQKPFFLAVGISKPHLPWYVPQEYFDRHPLSSIRIPEHRRDDLDDILDADGRKKFKPSADYRWVATSEELLKRAVQAYLAATSYADECVGMVFDALERSPARDNTIVVIFGDHGWHLTEKLRFRKATLWAESTRLPLLMRVPGMKGRQDCPRVVNLIDLYPTLIELCGLPAKPGIDGRSLAPLLRDPQTPWEHPSITINGRGNACILDERWYFIRYRDGTEEFYDMQPDPLQWKNLIRSPDPVHRAQIQRLAQLLPTTYAPDVPPNTGGREAKQAPPDPSIKATRPLEKLK
ncbi:MAG: sulfatase [Opitutaceae bacterium]|nr:sulfatase [Opitutaceae bacterium]